MHEDRLDQGTILDAGDDPKRSAAGRTALDVAAVDASQALCLYAVRVQPIALRRSGLGGSCALVVQSAVRVDADVYEYLQLAGYVM